MQASLDALGTINEVLTTSSRMPIQKNIRVVIAMLSFAITTTSPLPSVNQDGWTVAADLQTELAQKQPGSPTEKKEKDVTLLFDISGRKLAEIEGWAYLFSPDGQKLLIESSLGSGRYYLFDLSGKKLLQFEARTAEFSPDGKRILALLRNKDYFQLYDARGQKLAELPGSTTSPIFSQNSQHFVTFTEDSTYLFNASGQKMAQMQGQFNTFGSGFNATGERLVLYRFYPAECTLFNSTGQAIAKLPGACVRVSLKQNRFLLGTGGWDNPKLHLYDFSGKEIARLSGMFAFFDSNEKLILTTDLIRGDSSYLYNSTGKEIAHFRGTNGRFSPKNDRLVTVFGDTVYLYDLSGQVIAQVPGHRAAFLPKSGKFVTFLFGENQNRLDVSGGKSRLFDASGRELAVLQGDFDITNIVMYAAGGSPPMFEEIETRSFPFFSPDGERLVTSNSQHSYLYDTSGKLIAKLPGLYPSFSSTGQYITTVLKSKEDQAGKVYVFNHSGTILMETQGEFVMFSPDDQHIVIGAKRR